MSDTRTPDRWLTLTLGAATAIPYGLLGGFGSSGGDSILPWVGALAGWTACVLVARLGVRRGWWHVAHDDRSSMSAYLRLLGLKSTCTADEVQRAYRKRAKRYHPDHGGDADKFRELVDAKEHVLDGLENA
jgi:hypothetical protein